MNFNKTKQNEAEFVLEVNIDRVSELTCIGNSFKVPRQIVSEIDGSGKCDCLK